MTRHRFLVSVLAAGTMLIATSAGAPAWAKRVRTLPDARAELVQQAGGEADPGDEDAAVAPAAKAVYSAGRLRVTIEGLDPERFPEGCVARWSAGSASGTAALEEAAVDETDAASAEVTGFDVRVEASAQAGQSAEIRIECDDVPVREHGDVVGTADYATYWKGVFA